MPVKCSFCSEFGHSAQTCQSENAENDFEMLKDLIMDALEDDDSDIIDRAFSIYNGMKINHFRNRQYKQLLISIKRDHPELIGELQLTRGTRNDQLASAIIYFYFYKTHLVSEINNIHVTNFQKSMIPYNTHFWKLVCDGTIREVSIDSYNLHFSNIYYRILQARSLLRSQQPIEKFQIQFEIIPIDLTKDHFECSICMEDECSPFEKVVMNCNHSFCKNCVHQVLTDAKSKGKHPTCALCRQNFSKIQFVDQTILNEFSKIQFVDQTILNDFERSL